MVFVGCYPLILMSLLNPGQSCLSSGLCAGVEGCHCLKTLITDRNSIRSSGIADPPLRKEISRSEKIYTHFSLATAFVLLVSTRSGEQQVMMP